MRLPVPLRAGVFPYGLIHICLFRICPFRFCSFCLCIGPPRRILFPSMP